MSKKDILDFKVIILGMSEVGKTCLLINYFDKKFKENNISTIGIDFKTKFFKFDEKKVKINYVDTAGQERFHAISSNYLKNANGILLVYSVNSRASFTLLEDWMKEVKNHSGNLPIIICANKCDLNETREVPAEDGEHFAEKINSKFYEVSAKSGYNVATVFDEIARLTYEASKDEDNEEHGQSLKSVKTKKKGGCCSKEGKESD